MPFPRQTPKPFTRAAVLAFDPHQFGVYGLFRDSQWIYIGRGNIRAGLLDLLNGANSFVARMHPTHWVSEVTTDLVQRQEQLVREFKPTCNNTIA